MRLSVDVMHSTAKGADIVLASPLCGQPPLFLKSALQDFQTELTHRLNQAPVVQHALANTVKQEAVKLEGSDAVFYLCGHAPLWDLTNSEESIKLIKAFTATNKPTGFVCHAQQCDVT